MADLNSKCKAWSAFLAVSALTIDMSVAWADDATHQDKRLDLGLTAAERNEFLSEMRQMLASVQGIVAGISTEDRQKIAKSARYSGNRMARATPVSVRRKLPPSFRDIGGDTHMMFEEIAVRAEADDMDMLAALTGRLMQQCLTCHAMFRAN
ncbi:MAG: hypothetical protein EPN55_13555 [Gammaproteobacteria bacterium]|nr:MAG: hypothetical protein EPN55_13555 [Gammaproteobacteria bacterium]